MVPSASDQPNGRGVPATGDDARRVLLVEDEFLVAAVLQEDLESIGLTVVGPFTSLAMASEALQHEEVDLAVLDINLNGEMVYPLADELLARKIPFLFLSGYVTANLPERFRSSPRLAKPYDPQMLADRIREIAAKLG